MGNLVQVQGLFLAVFNDMEFTPLTTFNIELCTGVVPHKCARLRRFSPKECEFVDRQLDMLRQAGSFGGLICVSGFLPLWWHLKRGHVPGMVRDFVLVMRLSMMPLWMINTPSLI